MRGWLMAVTMDKEGNYKSMEQYCLMIISAARLICSSDRRVICIFLNTVRPGSKAMQTQHWCVLSTTVATGNPMLKHPLIKLQEPSLSSKAFIKRTIDYDTYDKDALKYEWKVTGNGFDKTLTEPDPAFTLDKPGKYTATLTVS
jgi:cytochrome c